MTIRITDSVALGESIITDAGYLEANARTARTGVQQNLGSELGRPDLAVVNVYRDESEVFAKNSLNTFSKIPITNDHPDTDVNAGNWKALAVGTAGDEGLRDGEFLKIGLKSTDAAAVQAVKDGKRELSVGYAADIIWQDGIAPDGTPYQAVQKNIIANHVAIVDHGRAGRQARIGDSWGASPVKDFKPGSTPTNRKTGGRMSDTTLKTVVIGDSAVQVAATDAALIEQFKKDSAQALADAESKHSAAIEAKDTEIGELKVQLKAAQDAANIDVDALVAARTALVSQVKALDSSIDPTGKTDAELRKAAVVAKLGDSAVADVSDAEVAGMFKALAAVAPAAKNPVADAMRGGLKVVDDNTQLADAHNAYVARLTRKTKEA